MNPTDNTAAYVLDLIDPSTEERWSVYRCDTCFALVLSEDAADHGEWHRQQAARTEGAMPDPCGEEMRATYDREEGAIWISCTRHAGHDGPHEDEHYGTKWGAR